MGKEIYKTRRAMITQLMSKKIRKKRKEKKSYYKSLSLYLAMITLLMGKKLEKKNSFDNSLLFFLGCGSACEVKG